MSRKAKKYMPISIRTCCNCGQEYLFLSRCDSRRKYCSRECAREFKSIPIPRAELNESIPLDKPKPVVRICLKCGQRFDSWGVANRLCKNCRQDNNSLARSYSEVALAGEKWTAI